MFAIFGLGNSSAYRRYQASAYVNEEIFTEDLLDPTNFDTRADESSLTMTTGVIRKYDRTAGETPFNIVLYRYADVLLMKAEALAMLNRGQKPLLLLNKFVPEHGLLFKQKSHLTQRISMVWVEYSTIFWTKELANLPLKESVGLMY
jgi:hypothetical protein